jgi:ABC-type dipeptide/oligopeptide/nickel transport system ATPase component
MRGLTLRIPTSVAGHARLVEPATDVDLSLESGRVHALVGESGAGKSVLASAFTGLLPAATMVLGGTVEVAGQDVTHALTQPRDRVWRTLRGRIVGVVPQSAATSFTPTRTIGRQLHESVRALGGQMDVAGLAEAARLPAWALAAYPHELSGGLAARAGLAGALAGQPSILIADEPTASLDPELSQEVLGLLRAQADAGVAVLLITHDVVSLLDGGWADEVSVMYAGRLVEQGPAGGVLGRPEHAYTRALIEALPRNGLRAAGDPESLLQLDTVGIEEHLGMVG